MPQLLFADNFQAGALLSLLMPLLLLCAIAVYYVVSVKRVPKDTPTSSAALPPSDVVAAAQEAETGEAQPPPAGS